MSGIFADGAGVEANLIDRQNFVNDRDHFIELVIAMVGHTAGEDNFWPTAGDLSCSARLNSGWPRVKLEVEFDIVQEAPGAVFGFLTNGASVDDQLVAVAPVGGFSEATSLVVGSNSL